MPSGDTTTGALADSLNSVIASARIVREYEGVMPQLVSKWQQPEGEGLDFREISLSQLTAQAVGESTRLNNPQLMIDTLFTVTPTVSGIHILITDRVAARISKVAYAKTGALGQNALQRKKDEDGLAVFASATTTLAGTGVTLTSGHLSAATYRIQSDTDEPGMPPYRIVLHGLQVKDIYDELVSGVGTYIVGEGLTARVFSEGFQGMIAGGQVYVDGNITPDATPDARGGVFAEEAIVLAQGRSPRAETRREPDIGGGATSIFLYDEYAYGERSAGNWLYGVLSDATVPTS